MSILKKSITTQLIMSLIYMVFPVNVFAGNIENIADINYKNEQRKSFTTVSNKASTSSIDLNGFKVDLAPLFNSVDGQSKGTWIFPVKLNNTGIGNDTYNLSLNNLPDGVIGEIYSDTNGNGILDPEDKIVTITSLVQSGNTFPLIISLTDIKVYFCSYR